MGKELIIKENKVAAAETCIQTCAGIPKLWACYSAMANWPQSN